MPFRNLSLAEIYEDLGRSIEAESAISAYQTREGIPSTIDTPGWMRPPPADDATANSAQAFQKIVQDTRQMRLTELIQDRIRSVDLLFEDIQRPGYDSERLYTELIRRRQNHLDDIRERNVRTNPTPPQTPPPTTDRKPPPTSLDNAPSLRTAQTSGARAPVTATAPPRPAQPSHWNLYQPPGATAPPATRAIPRTIDLPPTRLPQSFPRGRIAGGAAIGLDLGLRLYNGQDIGQAAYGAAGGLAGGLAGQGLGQAIGAGIGAALGGPPGAAVGGTLGGWIGSLGGGYAGGSLADRYYPGNNAPLPGAFPLNQLESVPLPRPFAPSPFTPGPAVPFDPLRPGDRRPRLGNIPDPSDPVSGFGPYFVEWRFQLGGEAQRENPVQIPAGGELHGPLSFSQRFDAVRTAWIVTLIHFGRTTEGRRSTPIVEPIEASGGWPDRPPRNFTVQNLSLPDSPPQPFNPSNAWPPTPENAPRPNPNNSPNDQYQPNPLPQTTPSPTGQPTGEPLPGNLGGNEPELQPQRSPDRAQRPTPGDRAYPPGASSGGAGTGSGNSGFPTVPLVALAAAVALPAVVRARIRTTAQRPTPTTQPRGSGTANPPPPPATPEEPCRGNRCSQRQLQGIDDANLRLLRLEQGLLGGVDLGSNAAILAKLDIINAKLGPQIPGGGIASFIKKLWDSQLVTKVLNMLTFVTVLHNAYMLSNNITQTLFSAFDTVLEFFGADLKNAEGQDISTSQWIGDAVEGFFNNIFGTETVNGIQANWKKFNRIYQAASNILSSFQSIMYSALESMEVIGNYVAQIGNAAKRFGVFADNCYRWMNPNNNFTTNRYFNALNNAQEAVETIDEVAGEALSIQQTGAELFTQKEALSAAVAEVIPGDVTGRPSNTSDTPQHQPSDTFETKLVQESQKVLIPIPDSAEIRQEPPDE